MSGRTAMKHAIEIGFRWDALVLFDPPNVPPPAIRSMPAMEAFEARLTEFASNRRSHFDSVEELAADFAKSRMGASWAPGVHALMARAVLRVIRTAMASCWCATPPTKPASMPRRWP